MWAILTILILISYLKIPLASINLDQYHVIFVPEEHTSAEDHSFQLSVIEHLHRKGYRLIIAMEMFQQPFQTFLDQYIDCQIDEREMLIKTEYEKRWGFDPALYRDIWRFAKEKGIKIAAINLPSELIRKIRTEGLERVRDDLLPAPIIEQTDYERKRLREVLKNHPKVDERSFFDVQNAWDNGMALAIARLLERYPSHKIIVLVGRGHAYDYDSGIPRRLKIMRSDVRMKILRREDYSNGLLFSIDFSRDSSSASSIKDPNCNP